MENEINQKSRNITKNLRKNEDDQEIKKII